MVCVDPFLFLCRHQREIHETRLDRALQIGRRRRDLRLADGDASSEKHIELSMIDRKDEPESPAQSKGSLGC
jgi:hypothetical protein